MSFDGARFFVVTHSIRQTNLTVETHAPVWPISQSCNTLPACAYSGRSELLLICRELRRLVFRAAGQR
jgi:hypothetical protein